VVLQKRREENTNVFLKILNVLYIAGDATNGISGFNDSTVYDNKENVSSDPFNMSK